MTGPPLRVQVGRLARRSIARTLRQPVLIVPNLVFPLFMLLVLSANGDQVTKVKGFPTHSYITFLLAATLVQGAASATTLAGNLLGSDIESGFLSRIGLTPVRGSALVAAQLAGVAVLGINDPAPAARDPDQSRCAVQWAPRCTGEAVVRQLPGTVRSWA